MRTKITVLILSLLFVHKAYAATEGNCYKPRNGKPKHMCMKIEEGKKFFADLEALEHQVKKDIPDLKKQVRLLELNEKILKNQRRDAEAALKKGQDAVIRMEKISGKISLENNGLLVTAEKYKKEADKFKRERWNYLLIGVGTGVVVTAVVVTAIALYAKPFTVTVAK